MELMAISEIEHSQITVKNIGDALEQNLPQVMAVFQETFPDKQYFRYGLVQLVLEYQE